MRRNTRITALLLWLLISTGAYTSVLLGAASPPATVESIGGVSDFTAAGIHYALSTADPSRLERVTFTLAPNSPGTQVAAVRAKLVGASSIFFPCTNAPSGSASWECAVGGVPVAAANQLTLDVDRSTAPKNYTLWLPFIRR